MFDGNAALSIPFESFEDSNREHDPIEPFRQEAHKIMDDFIDQLSPSLLSDEPLTLEKISEIFQSKRPELLGRLVEEFIKVHHCKVHDQTECACPRCSQIVKAMGKRKREVQTAQGTVQVERPYFYCRDCKEGFSPVDSALDLSRSKKQHDLQQKALKLLAQVPFGRASELFEDLTGIPFSDHSLHELFERFSEDVRIEEVLPSREEIERQIQEVSTPGKWRPLLVVSCDGAKIPIRAKGGRNDKRGPGEYKEVKGFRLYLMDGERIVHLASWHQIKEARAFREDLQVMARRVAQDKVRIALVGDGAPWLWTAMKEAFPEGREILDYYHCLEKLHALARTQYQDNPDRALEWVLETLVRLHYAQVHKVIGGLKRMKPRSEEAAEQIRTLITYLTNNRRRIHYRSDRLGKYPVGSGGIESANKFICHARLKISGAWWLKANSNAMLRLRCAIFNHTFQRVFSKHVTIQKAKRLLTNS